MVNLNFDKDYGHQICTVQGSFLMPVATIWRKLLMPVFTCDTRLSHNVDFQKWFKSFDLKFYSENSENQKTRRNRSD